MPFEGMGLAAETIGNVSSIISSAGVLSSRIQEDVTLCLGVSLIPPDNLFRIGSNSITPNVPPLPGIFFPNPFDTMTKPEPESVLSLLDPCHFQFGASSVSVIDTVMKAISNILESVIDIAKTAVMQAITMLVQVVETIVTPLWTWIKETAKSINKTIGDTYTQWKNNGRDAEMHNDTITAMLWDRATIWLNKKWGLISDALDKIWADIGEFIDLLTRAKDIMVAAVGTLATAMTGWVNDAACLTKAGTEAFS